MLRFRVFDQDGAADGGDAGGAGNGSAGGGSMGGGEVAYGHMIGREGRMLPGSIEYADGEIRCSVVDETAAALAVQRDCGEAGVLLLQTCLLPQSSRAYVLDLELARHRVMTFLTKMEEWGLSAMPEEHELLADFASTQLAFARAVAHIGDDGDRVDASGALMAREALVRGVRACERLASVMADVSWKSRDRVPSRLRPSERVREATAPPRAGGEVGCAVTVNAFGSGLQVALQHSADFVLVPTRWREIEPEEGRFDLSAIDRWIEWAKAKAKLPVVAGPVLDFGPRGAPDWLYVWEHDYDSLRDFACEHAKRVVTRYRRAVDRWIIASGLNENQGFALSIEQMLKLTRIVTTLVRKLAPASEVVVELNHPFAECVASGARAVHPALFGELALESGLDIDAFAIRVQMGDREYGRATRDLMELSSMLDLYGALEVPLDVILGAPSGANDEASGGGRGDGVLPDGSPGRWRGGWDESTQAEWLTEAMSIALAKPTVRTVAWHTLCDLPGASEGGGADALCDEMSLGGLIRSDGQGKAGLVRLAEARKALQMGASPRQFREAREAAERADGGGGGGRGGGDTGGEISSSGDGKPAAGGAGVDDRSGGVRGTGGAGGEGPRDGEDHGA